MSNHDVRRSATIKPCATCGKLKREWHATDVKRGGHQRMNDLVQSPISW